MKTHVKKITLPLLALALCGCDSKQSEKTNIIVREYQHPQWGNVIKLANSEIEVIVAPERGGRLMHYSRVGESNLLWTAADINTGLGDVWGWRNWGGEKTWPWPQDKWPWPPPLEFEQNAYKAKITPIAVTGAGGGSDTGYKITMRGKHVTRTVTLWSKKNRVDINAAFNESSKMPGIEHFSVWSVTQIPLPEKIILERAAPNRLLLQMKEGDNTLVMSDENTVDIAATPNGTKGMMDATGFRVPTAQGTLVVRQLDAYGKDAYDGVYRAQVYTSGNVEGDGYVELEFAAPLNGPARTSQTVVLSLE